MSYRIKLTSKGQITLPKEIREQLFLKFGDYLQAQVKDGSIVLQPKRGDNDNMLIMEYARQYVAKTPKIKSARELTKSLNLNMTERVRKMRDEIDE